MRKDLIILVTILIGFMLVTLTGRVDSFLTLSLLVLTLCVYIILWFVFACTRRKKILKNFQKSYSLEVLDNTENEIYVLKKYISNEGNSYYFSYIDENGKKVVNLQSNVGTMCTSKEPYVEIYKNVYKPKGFLDFLFYSKEISEYESVIYVLYVNDDMIKTAG